MQKELPMALPTPIDILVLREVFDCGSEEGVDVGVEVGVERGRFVDVDCVSETKLLKDCDVEIVVDGPVDEILEVCIICVSLVVGNEVLNDGESFEI